MMVLKQYEIHVAMIALCILLLVAGTSLAGEPSRASKGFISPTILVGPPVASSAAIDPFGYSQFKARYRERESMVYSLNGDVELLASSYHARSGRPLASEDASSNLKKSKSVNVEYSVEASEAQEVNEPLSLLEVNYYVFDAKIFDEQSSVHPHGWGTILVAGLGNNVEIGRELSQQCVIFDITAPERGPVRLAQFSQSTMSACSAQPSALILPDPFDGSPHWYLAFGSGVGAETPILYLYDLQVMALSDEVRIPQRASPYPPQGDAYVGGISAADINQDGITDLLYFGTVGIGETGGSLYSLTFAKNLAAYNMSREKGPEDKLPFYVTPRLARLFQSEESVFYKPLVKRGPEGRTWLFFSTASSVYALKEDFSQQRIRKFQLGSGAVKDQGWYRTIPKPLNFTSAITDLGEVIALNSFQGACDECVSEGLNRLHLFRAFNGEEITELLDDKKQRAFRDLFEGVEGFPRNRVDPTIFSPEMLRSLPELSALDKEKELLQGVKVAEGVRRLSWWQQ